MNRTKAPALHNFVGRLLSVPIRQGVRNLFNRLFHTFIHKGCGKEISGGGNDTRAGPPQPETSTPESAVAIPRKERKPAISVTVVKMIDEDSAGS